MATGGQGLLSKAQALKDSKASAVKPATKEARTVILQGDVDIDQAETYYKYISDAFLEASRVVIDLSGVETIDVAGLQLLIASKKESIKTGIPIDFIGDMPSAILAYKDYLTGEGKEDLVVKSFVKGEA